MSELSPEAVRVLVRARELLQRGWCQGMWQMEDRFCLWGAARMAWAEAGETYNVANEVCEALNAGSDPVNGMSQWNDEPGRTQEDVLRLLDGIMARERK